MAFGFVIFIFSVLKRRRVKSLNREQIMHPLYKKADELTHEVIGAAIEVHRDKGPGLIESIYEKCLMREFTQKKDKKGRVGVVEILRSLRFLCVKNRMGYPIFRCLCVKNNLKRKPYENTEI